MSCNSKMASFPVNYVRWLPSDSEGMQCQLTEYSYSKRVLYSKRVSFRLSVQRNRDENCTPVMRQSLSQSEAFPPLSAECSNIIRLKSYKRRCACTSVIQLIQFVVQLVSVESWSYTASVHFGPNSVGGTPAEFTL